MGWREEEGKVEEEERKRKGEGGGCEEEEDHGEETKKAWKWDRKGVRKGKGKDSGQRKGG
jgi:hypothetical protein